MRTGEKVRELEDSAAASSNTSTLCIWGGCGSGEEGGCVMCEVVMVAAPLSVVAPTPSIARDCTVSTGRPAHEDRVPQY